MTIRIPPLRVNRTCRPARPLSALIISFFLCIPGMGSTVFGAQKWTPETLREMVVTYKEDPRGPYQAIKWFCPDGAIIPAKERCEKPGGIQHGLPKEEVRALGEERGIYLGQILAGAPHEKFWDAENRNSRLKQYILEQYLRAADDGWIMRRARFYRGAVQAEDEERWGREFLIRLLAEEDAIESQFYLVRQAVKEIPHRSQDDLWTRIRAVSSDISDKYPAFMDLRAKLHGKPEAGDIDAVRRFLKSRQADMPSPVSRMIQGLVNDLERAFESARLKALSASVDRLPATLSLRDELNRLVTTHAEVLSSEDADAWLARFSAMADLLLNIREQLPDIESPEDRLTLLDISVDLETVFFRDAVSRDPQTYRMLLEKGYLMTRAAAGCGFLELWEWEEVGAILSPPRSEDQITRDRFADAADYVRRVVEWSTGMVQAVYGPVIETFSEFEPEARGFLDDRVRSSLVLPLGETAGRFSNVKAVLTDISNQVTGVSDPGRIRGLNPGFARGELVVVQESAADIRFEDDKIYVLPRVPADMKPVAGVATASEGNLVSHVQLLARNLGIPNAVISPEHIRELAPFSGRIIFYAVSPGGRVIMKPASEMTDQERALVETGERADERIAAPTEKLDLKQKELLALESLRSSDSGRVCGPKAANLGQLKHLFPDHVADGLVIPFGVFRAHMDRRMPGTGHTYWDFLEATFSRARKDRAVGNSADQAEPDIPARLNRLHQAIREIEFLPGFEAEFANRFAEVLGSPPGEIPVFVRSDTNMEDLEEFTGAGLNLTVFNVRDAGKIHQGIRDVWASPFSERSYLWRQKFMLNPENVYPSILILPTVPVDKSGVLITTGLSGGGPEDLTVAFSRGPGGAVEGQAAESYLVHPSGEYRLLSPSRERKFNILPMTGGLEKGYGHFHRRILAPAELNRLRDFAGRINRLLPGAPGIGSTGPFDVELGFLGEKIWLFQVRPYVENKRAQGSSYLRSLDQEIP